MTIMSSFILKSQYRNEHITSNYTMFAEWMKKQILWVAQETLTPIPTPLPKLASLKKKKKRFYFLKELQIW